MSDHLTSEVKIQELTVMLGISCCVVRTPIIQVYQDPPEMLQPSSRSHDHVIILPRYAVLSAV